MTVRPTHTLFPHAPVPALPSEGLIGVIAPAGPAPLDTDKAVQWMRARVIPCVCFPVFTNLTVTWPAATRRG